MFASPVKTKPGFKVSSSSVVVNGALMPEVADKKIEQNDDLLGKPDQVEIEEAMIMKSSEQSLKESDFPSEKAHESSVLLPLHALDHDGISESQPQHLLLEE